MTSKEREEAIAVLRDAMEELGVGPQVREVVSRALRMGETEAEWLLTKPALRTELNVAMGPDSDRGAGARRQYDLVAILRPDLAHEQIEDAHQGALQEDRERRMYPMMFLPEDQVPVRHAITGVRVDNLVMPEAREGVLAALRKRR